MLQNRRRECHTLCLCLKLILLITPPVTQVRGEYTVPVLTLQASPYPIPWKDNIY